MSVSLNPFFLLFLFLPVKFSSTVEVLTYYGQAGGNVTIPCIFLQSGPVKLLWRKTYEGENLLIETRNNTAQHGRYITKYVKETTATYSVLSVSISELNRSDSGLYRCGLGDSPISASLRNFSVVVVDAVLDGHKEQLVYKKPGSSLTVACSFKSSKRTKTFCRGECGEEEVLVQTNGSRANRGRYSIEYVKGPTSAAVLLVNISQLTQSDSGWYRCLMDRTLFRDFCITVTQDVPLTVGVTLVIVAIVISAAILVFCWRRHLRDVENSGISIGSNIKEDPHGSSNLKGPYHDLSSATRDQNPIYYTLGELKRI